MKKMIKILTVIASIILMPSFTEKSNEAFVGTYSVCDSDPSDIRLIINTDHTFYYQDFSNRDKKMMVNGSWIIKGNKVMLKSNEPSVRFQNVWRFVDNGQVAKSVKGLTFYRLGKVSA